MNLVTFESHEVRNGGFVSLVGDHARHVLEILKVTPGSKLRVGQLGGGIGTAVVSSIENEVVQIKLEHLGPTIQPAPIDVIVAVPRPQTVKKVLQLAAYVAVRKIMFISSERVEKNYFSSRVLRPEETRHYVRLGLEQAGSTFVPAVSIHPKFHRFIEDQSVEIEQAEIKLIAYPDAKLHIARLGLEKRLQQETPVIIAIGPEGDWRENEIEAFEKLGFVAANLGKPILRVEDALCSLLGQIELLRNQE